ncbi:Wzz/FepE/Etk N-terminal domain-containing protein [Photobacterium atrarenae]|uniref:Wzz/FepE/Etk N-terminal domain-containing protein n=1 Tax=Photobacterium atrarenae TaxID=865757 RepID=A0ABY5GCM2_9GAMM|nr:Wzz/FepE/Etk N-terminal domain-containing protein [Photobacterium atrarenae]UTV26975.1 Wzz/FepE/Etk N-terminal domain-containing protein [Photobacterium atrarenae]
MNQQHSSNSESLESYQMSQISTQPNLSNGDENRELKALFAALWKGKWIIIACTMVVTIGAIIHALTAQEWWSSRAIVMKPQLRDFSIYHQQVKQFQPVFDIYQGDGPVLVSEDLDDLVEPKELFSQFINAFNSSMNKKAFLDVNADFKQIKSQLDDIQSEGLTDRELDLKRRALYSKWFQKITASPLGKEKELYVIQFQSTGQDNSYKMLIDYINFTKAKVNHDLLNNLNAVVNAKKNELLQQKSILEVQAKQRLEIEAARSQYALEIAEAALISKPVQNLGENEIFAINIGGDALKAKIEALKSVTNLKVIEPKLEQVDAKLKLLEATEIKKNIDFSTFRYMDEVELPIARDKPERSLIAVLGMLLGGVLGITIVLIRAVFGKDGILRQN